MKLLGKTAVWTVLFVFLYSITSTLGGCRSMQTTQDTGNVLDTMFHPGYYRSVSLASKLGVKTSYLTELKLYSSISNWLGLPYSLDPKFGVDNIRLLQEILKDVYDIKLPPTYGDLIKDNNSVGVFTEKHCLTEGDLLFFEIPKHKIVDNKLVPDKDQLVGMYLVNDHFVIVSEQTEKVSIENLNSDPWRRNYVISGRCKLRNRNR